MKRPNEYRSHKHVAQATHGRLMHVCLKINAWSKLKAPRQIQVLSCANYQTRVYTCARTLTYCRSVPYYTSHPTWYCMRKSTSKCENTTYFLWYKHIHKQTLVYSRICTHTYNIQNMTLHSHKHLHDYLLHTILLHTILLHTILNLLPRSILKE